MGFMRIKQLFFSTWFYYLMYVVSLLIFRYIILPFWVLNETITNEQAYNLYSESWGLIFTIILLILVLDLRESIKWRSVKSKVYNRISIQLSGIFSEFVNLCECIIGGAKAPNESMDDFLRRLQRTQLEELNRRIELNDIAKKHLPEGAFADLFDARKQYLSNIEMKYFNFLDSEVVLSLMEIQDNLNQLSMSIRIQARAFLAPTDEEFFEEISTLIHNTVREIYNLNTEKREIEIF